MTPPHCSSQYRKKAIPLRLARAILLHQQRRLYRLYATCFPPLPGKSVLDLGVNASLELPEQYFFEAHYPYRSQVVAAGLEEGERFEQCYSTTRYVQLRRDEPLPFDDHSFDVVFCNAVIEHVGSRRAQRRFLTEIVRVGRGAFVTTPNRWYPIELHTVTPLLHWLPAPGYRAIYRALGFEFFSQEENLNLLDRRSLAALIPQGVKASIMPFRFLGMTSNLVAVFRGSRPSMPSPERWITSE